jgi:hypothetical protein
MALTAAQLATLKADILANTATIPAGQPWTGAFAGVQVKDVPNDGDGNIAVAGWYNQPHATWIVWRDLPMETVLGLITYANMTPLDAVPTTPALTVDVYRARALCCQGKQFNLQNLTLGRSTAPMKKTNYRAALQDCLTNIPAGAAGALIAANWTGVRDGAKFAATNAEKLFSTGTGSSATPADLVYEGAISGSDVNTALNLP